VLLQQPWDIKAATRYTVERGICYKYNLADLDRRFSIQSAISMFHGAVVLENVPRHSIPPGFQYVDNLDVDGFVHLVVKPLGDPKDAQLPKETLVVQGVRGVVWSATEVLKAPHGDLGWCHAFGDHVESIFDGLEWMEAVCVPERDPPRAYLVLGFTPTLQLAYIPNREDILGFYDAERSRYKQYSWSHDLSAHVWLMCSTTAVVPDFKVLAAEFGSTHTIIVSAQDPRLDADVDFWGTEVWPAVRVGQRVTVILTDLVDMARLQPDRVVSMCLGHDVCVSLMTRDAIHGPPALFACSMVTITEWQFPIRALGIVRAPGKTTECAWVPPRPEWTTPATAVAPDGDNPT
jgi:hypothetical protein